MEWSPLCSDHVQRKDYCLFTGLENLQIFQTCLFTGVVERESFNYKDNLHLKRRYKKAAAPDHEQRLRYLLFVRLSVFSSLCIVLGKQGVQVVLVLAVAEVAHYLTSGVLVPHPHKLCTAKAE